MSDWFADAFGAAVADVRRELVERAWFGRPERADPGSSWDWGLHEKSDRTANTASPHETDPAREFYGIEPVTPADPDRGIDR